MSSLLTKYFYSTKFNKYIKIVQLPGLKDYESLVVKSCETKIL